MRTVCGEVAHRRLKRLGALRFSQRDHLGLHADRGIGRLALFANEGGPAVEMGDRVS